MIEAIGRFLGTEARQFAREALAYEVEAEILNAMYAFGLKAGNTTLSLNGKRLGEIPSGDSRKGRANRILFYEKVQHGENGYVMGVKVQDRKLFIYNREPGESVLSPRIIREINFSQAAAFMQDMPQGPGDLRFGPTE